MDSEKRRRGRPLKDGARRKEIHILMTDEEYDLLLNTSKKVGKSMSEIVRKGVMMSARGESDLYDLQHENDDFDEF